MSLNELLQDVDSKFAEGELVNAAKEYYDKSVETHVQDVVRLKNKSAIQNLERLEGRVGEEGTVDLLGNRVVEYENATVSLFAIDGKQDDDSRYKSLLLVARRWSEKGKIVEEEYLPVRSTADAQPYFPKQRLASKQVQPRLGFIAQTRKRRGKGGGRPRKAVEPTDLHLIPTVGKTVLQALNKAGISTFETLSQAADDVLEAVRSESGRRFTNFDPSYWRTAAEYAFKGEWDKIPAVPKAQKKTRNKDEKIDFTKVGDRDLHLIDKVGPNLLKAFHSKGIETFEDLANASDETLEELRVLGGRPFVNFDMSYFRTVGKRKVAGQRHMPAPPKPMPKKSSGRKGRKAREINPNDLHILPGIGAQLVAALHKVGINTFTDLAEAPKKALIEARSYTRGKFKNIDPNFLQRNAKYAAKGQFDKIDEDVKIDPNVKPVVVSAEDRQRARLAKGDAKDLQALPGVGPSVQAAMNEKGINTLTQLAKAKVEDLREIAQNAGKRFARFDVEFWKQVAEYAKNGEFDKIPLKAPKAPKPDKPKKPRGGQRGPRQARPPRQPKDQKDLGALPTVGATLVTAFNEAGISTFSQLASASDSKLEEVRAKAGPKFKTFPVSYWKEVAQKAKEGSMDYPPVPKKEKKASTGRRGRAPKEVQPTDLRRLPNVGASMERSLRENGLNTFEDIVNAEAWRISKAGSEAGKRFAKVDPEEFRKAARDAMSGKFPEPVKREKNASRPEGADKLTELPRVGKKVQGLMFERGLKTYQDVAEASTALLEDIRDNVGRILSGYDVRKWKEAAQNAIEGNWSKVNPSKYSKDDDATGGAKSAKPKAPEGGDDLTRIKGVKPSVARFWNSRGVKTYQDVLSLSDDALQALLEDSNAGIKPEDYQKVQESAAKMLSKNSKNSGKKKKKSKA